MLVTQMRLLPASPTTKPVADAALRPLCGDDAAFGKAGATGAAGSDTLLNINQVRGSFFGDTLVGSTSAWTETLDGREGNDTLSGGGGRDSFIGGAGDDVIDGGLGQVGAALAAFKEHDLVPPPLIGLAKREETIVFPDGRELKLPRHDVGLALLMRIRDEAHHFANDFNAELRSRKLRESLLDEMPGLGPKRKDALLAHFGSIQKLRKATVEQIAEVEGLSDKLAGEVKAYLEARG